jgi:hypothetical protein
MTSDCGRYLARKWYDNIHTKSKSIIINVLARSSEEKKIRNCQLLHEIQKLFFMKINKLPPIIVIL